jgi:hypothetical protein
MLRKNPIFIRNRNPRRPKVGKKTLKFIWIICMVIGLALTAMAQKQTGSLKGKVTDTEGFPLPGAFVYIDSPSMLDIKTYITSEIGIIKFHNLPPGKYRISVEMPGFKTVNIENIIIHVGMTVRVHITMEITTIEEEIAVNIPSPTGDPESSKTSVILEEDLIKRIPIVRDLHGIITLAPGVSSESIFFPKTSIIHGSNARTNSFTFDSMNLGDPTGMQLITNINTDLIEEIEVVTGGLPTPVGLTDGGYVNVVTKSGGNDLFGETIVYHTSESLASKLVSDEELSATGVSPPPLDKKLWDFSLSFGGPILRDNLWFFTNARFISQSQTTSFIPWTDPQGKKHAAYDWDNSEKMGFIKFTSKFIPALKVTAMFNYVNRNRPLHATLLDWNVTADATRYMDHEKIYQGNAILNYVFDQDTFLDLKAGLFESRFPMLLQEEVKSNPSSIDESTGHLWGSGQINENRLNSSYQVSVYMTRFQDNVLGVNHEIKLGGEYEQVSTERSAWKEDNLTVYYNDGSPYFFGMNPSPTSEKEVGKGKISFLIASEAKGGYVPKFEVQRLSLSFQDTATFAERLTLTIGLRFDRSTGSQLSFFKDTSGNPISEEIIGENLIEPLIDLNPYSNLQVSTWKNIMVWNALSPRIGLSFDIFGTGKSLFKASFARYTHTMMLDYVSSISIFNPTRSHSFFWYDENMDGIVDENDTFTLYPEDYRLYISDTYKQRVAPDTNSPYTNEFTIGLNQEIFSDFSVRLTYIYKNKKNIFENVLYNPDLDKDWYTIQQDTEGWWTPFNTIVPEIDDYPNTAVPVYFHSEDAPLLSERFKNVPELGQKYQGFEIAFKKRFSSNWQLNGSMTLSKTTGNMGLGYLSNSGTTSAADSPNYFVNYNEDARLDYDRPLIIKLAGTYRFPYDFYLSFFYMHLSGTPWARSVTVFPPASLATGEDVYGIPVTVYLENPGTRRTKAEDNLDLRIEKEFSLSRSRKISILVDVFNALGNKYQFIVQNDGGYWYPDTENSGDGIRIVSPNYKKVTSLKGARSFRFGLNFKF